MRMSRLYFSTLLHLTTVLLASSVSFPRDHEPINTVGPQGSSVYPVFQGSREDNETKRLGLDFQKMLKINATLYIAARDHVYIIDLRQSKNEIFAIREVTWRTKPEDMDNCAMRGKIKDECYNYIKVLVPRNGRTLFACGTNAFNPVCRSYQMSSLQQDGEELNGQARCPFDAKQTNVALFADGNLYSATMADFLASDAVIYRSLGDKVPVLRTVKYDSKWLREPHFLHAVDYGNYVYLFFREISMEYTTLGRVIFSRVARVCKNDMGGSPRVLEKYWTSFLKARLNCSVPGDSFFYFDVLQSVTSIVQINSRPAVIGVFSTQANSIVGSGVCAFYLDDIEKVFNGRFKEQKNAESSWTPIPEDRVPNPRPGSCAGYGAASAYKASNEFPDETLSFIKSYPLLDEAVSSVTNKPWFTKTNSRFRLTHITVDTSAGPYGNYTVLFLGSEDGKLLKVLSSTTENAKFDSLLLEEIDVYNPAKCTVKGEDRRILGLELDKSHHALFVAFSSCLIRVPLTRCESYGQCKKSCLASRDPYCVWLKSGTCATFEPRMRAGYEQDIEQTSTQHLSDCLDSVTTTGNRNNPGDSAYGVRQEPEIREKGKSVHFTFLIGCVLVAFILGATFSGLFVSCYCNHVLHKTKRLNKDPESSSTHPLSLRSLAKINGLLESQPKDALTEDTAPKLYTTLLPSEKEQQPNGTVKVGIKEHPELSGLPTPESTPELPLKNMKAIKNQWEKNQNCNNAKESQVKSPMFHSPLPNSQVFQFSNMMVPSHTRHAYDPSLSSCSDDRKIPNSERMLARHSNRYSQKGVDVNALDELLKHLHETSSSPKKMMENMPVSHPSMSAHTPVLFTNRVQPKIPDTESAPYYSSSTLPRDSLPRRMDIPPDVPPHSSSEQQARHPSHRHSMSSAQKLMNIASMSGVGISRQQSIGRGSGPHPPTVLMRMHSTGTPVPLEGHHNFLSRHHSYTDGSLPRGAVRRTPSIKPDVPPKPMFMPASSPVNPSNQFHY
ncbi:semaphorin-6D-like [Protopterus annectens]|uniref:semaphorin-6D-like n=1 Tax=Protopterus annectens TaxID=7888 RepID=UPI001CFBC054|nr:semaphorin-6D-like [Protopterus annectens]